MIASAIYMRVLATEHTHCKLSINIDRLLLHRTVIIYNHLQFLNHLDTSPRETLSKEALWVRTMREKAAQPSPPFCPILQWPHWLIRCYLKNLALVLKHPITPKSALTHKLPIIQTYPARFPKSKRRMMILITQTPHKRLSTNLSSQIDYPPLLFPELLDL